MVLFIDLWITYSQEKNPAQRKLLYNTTLSPPTPSIIISIWWTCPMHWIPPCSLAGSSATFPIIATEVFSSHWQPLKRPGARNCFLMPSDGHSHCQRRNNPKGQLAFVTVWNLPPHATHWLATRWSGAAVPWSDPNLFDKSRFNHPSVTDFFYLSGCRPSNIADHQTS